jgi:predicted deacylase
MHIQHHPLTACAPGTHRHLVSLHFGAAGGGRKAYLQAALHADEPPGLLVGWHLRQLLAEAEAAGRLRGEIVLVPMANPVGHGQRLLGRGIGRFELPSGENFNRHYADVAAASYARLRPALEAGTLPDVATVRAELRASCLALPAASELESLRKTLLTLAIDADLMLDLHCDNEAVMHLYTTPTLWPRLEPLARLIGAEVALLAGDSGGDPFDESCSLAWSRLNALHVAAGGPAEAWPEACAAATIELRGEADVSHEHAAADARALFDFLLHEGFVEGAAPTLPPLKRAGRPLAGSMPVYAPHGGVLVHRAPLGEEVAEGEPIADVIDPLEGTCTTLRAAVDGLLYAREHGRVVHAGTRIAKVSGLEALRSGPLLSA